MPESTPRPRTNTAALMIDGPTTRDRDDAFTVTGSAADGWTLTVHVADVARAVPINSELDLAARARAATLYRPRAVHPMLGPAAERAATLTDMAPRHALTITLDIAPDGTVNSTQCSRTYLAAKQCKVLTYESAERALADPDHEDHRHLQLASVLATTLLNRRRGAGALGFYDLNAGLELSEDGSIRNLPVWAQTGTYIVVAELMIAANTALAEWALLRELPIAYRNHRRTATALDAADILEDLATHAGDPAAVGNLRRRLQLTTARADYGPRPRGHYALALAAYTHATSPLRRYADLLTQRQVLAVVDETQPPYTAEQLDELTADLNAVLDDRKTAAAAFLERQEVEEVERIMAEKRYTQADPKQWRKAMMLAAQSGPPSDELLAALRRRIEGDALTVADVAAIATATDPEWLPIRAEAYVHMATAEPTSSPSIVAILTQVAGDAFDIDVSQIGPDHRLQFTATARCGDTAGPACTATSRKVAEQLALWQLLATLGGVKLPDAEGVASGGAPQPQGVPSAVPAVRPGPTRWSSEKQWRKVLKGAVAAAELDDAVRGELDNRIADDSLTDTDLALILGGRGSAWAAVISTAIEDTARTKPHLAAAAFTTALQHQTIPSPPAIETLDGGPDLPAADQRFTSTATVAGIAAAGAGSTKKAAEQAALWQLVVEVLASPADAQC